MTRHSRATLLALVLMVSFAGLAVAPSPAAASHAGGDGCSFPVTETDFSDTEVTIEEEPDEIVVTDAASAQTIWEIGAEDRITGMPVREYTEYLEGSEERTDVLTDDGMGVDVETVVELDPDLVIVPNMADPEDVQQLRDAGLTVYQSPFEESFEDIYAKAEVYGHFAGECEAGAETAAETRAEVETIRETVGDRDRPRVLYYFFEYTTGEGTFIGDMIETAGGENVAATAGIEGFDTISDEVIVEQDPEWIFSIDEDGAIDTERESLASTTAVQEDQVVRLDRNLVSQAGPRVVEPLRRMAETLHPEAFEEQPTATVTEDDDGTDGAGPGFGGGVAAAALVAAALLSRRP